MRTLSYSRILSNSPRIGVFETPLISYFISEKQLPVIKSYHAYSTNAIRYIHPSIPLFSRYLIAFIGPLVIFLLLIALRINGLQPRSTKTVTCFL